MLISDGVTAPGQNQLRSFASRNGAAFMRLDFKPEGVLEQMNMGYVLWPMCCSSWAPLSTQWEAGHCQRHQPPAALLSLELLHRDRGFPIEP